MKYKHQEHPKNPNARIGREQYQEPDTRINVVSSAKKVDMCRKATTYSLIKQENRDVFVGEINYQAIKTRTKVTQTTQGKVVVRTGYTSADLEEKVEE